MQRERGQAVQGGAVAAARLPEHRVLPSTAHGPQDTGRTEKAAASSVSSPASGPPVLRAAPWG